MYTKSYIMHDMREEKNDSERERERDDWSRIKLKERNKEEISTCTQRFI